MKQLTNGILLNRNHLNAYYCEVFRQGQRSQLEQSNCGWETGQQRTQERACQGFWGCIPEKVVKPSSVFRSTRTVLKAEHTILYFCLWCFFMILCVSVRHDSAVAGRTLF